MISLPRENMKTWNLGLDKVRTEDNDEMEKDNDGVMMERDEEIRGLWKKSMK